MVCPIDGLSVPVEVECVVVLLVLLVGDLLIKPVNLIPCCRKNIILVQLACKMLILLWNVIVLVNVVVDLSNVLLNIILLRLVHFV